MPEYHCSPVWLYDESGELLANDLPDDLNNGELSDLIKEVAHEYDSLYEDNEVVFEYCGFQNEISKQLFFSKVHRAIDILNRKAMGLYEIEVQISEK